MVRILAGAAIGPAGGGEPSGAGRDVVALLCLASGTRDCESLLTRNPVFREPGFRGCAFVAACSEAPPGGVIETDAAEYRAWRRDLFTGLARQAGAADPGQLGQQLNVLCDGAELTASMDHNPGIAAATRNAVTVLLEATIPAQQAPGHPADEPAARKPTAKKQSRG